MTLIKCKECNAEISDKAEKCPNCGYTINKKNGLGCFSWILIIFIIFIILIAISSRNTNSGGVINDERTYYKSWREPIGSEYVELGRIIVQNNIKICGEYYVKEIETDEFIIACTGDGSNWEYFVVYPKLSKIYRANDEMISKLSPPR